MNTRLSHLFVLAFALPLSSCRFVGARPDFSVLADSFRPAETDTVYVEARPAGSTRPTAPVAAATTSANHPPVPNGFYTVHPGDTLSRIARIHNVGLSSLASSNGIDLQRPLIRPGQILRIPGRGAPLAAPHPGMAAASSARPAAPLRPTATAPATHPTPPQATTAAPAGQYRVCAGDTAYRIAQKHRVSLPALLQANNLDDASARSLRVGTILTIPTQPHR